KLQTWKYGFTQVIDKAYKQYQKTSNRDITKFISSLSTEIFVTGKATHALKSFFSFARNKGAKLIQKAHELSEVPTVVTPEGITAQVNKAVKHTKGLSTAGSMDKVTDSMGKTLKGFSKNADFWISKEGLIYGPDKKYGSRINHILQHTVPNSNKLKHTVFTVTGTELFDLIDFAWVKRGAPLPNDPGTFIVELDKIIGTLGEKAIKIVTEPGTSNIITAYPIKV
ncbi:MAG: hypothetical protein WCD44_01965, partial [Candidatus Babeliales bacterium]